MYYASTNLISDYCFDQTLDILYFVLNEGAIITIKNLTFSNLIDSDCKKVEFGRGRGSNLTNARINLIGKDLIVTNG